MTSSRTELTPRTSIVQFGLWLVPESGGTYKSVRQFREALNSKVYSFTYAESLDKLSESEQNANYAEHILIRGDYIGRWYCIPQRSDVQKVKHISENADLIIAHCFWRWGAVSIWRSAMRACIPYWVVPHGSLDPYVFGYHRLAKRIWLNIYGRRILSDAQAVICASEMERRKVLQVAPKSNCIVLNWPVEPAAGVSHELRCKVRHEIGCRQSTRVLLCLGRLHPMKRIVELIEVFSDTAPSNCMLLIVGPGNPEYIREVENARLAFGRADSIVLLGPVYGSAKQALLGAADGFVSNSARENFGLAAAEALAASLPVILSPGNDLCYDLADVNCGWCLSDDKRETLRNALREYAAAAPPQLKLMGENGRSWVQVRLNPARFVAKINKLASESIGHSENR
jgi:glycosyltransferase involved in cell wall biosynthesis